MQSLRPDARISYYAIVLIDRHRNCCLRSHSSPGTPSLSTPHTPCLLAPCGVHTGDPVTLASTPPRRGVDARAPGPRAARASGAGREGSNGSLVVLSRSRYLADNWVHHRFELLTSGRLGFKTAQLVQITQLSRYLVHLNPSLDPGSQQQQAYASQSWAAQPSHFAEQGLPTIW